MTLAASPVTLRHNPSPNPNPNPSPSPNPNPDPTKALKEFLPALEAAGLVLRKTVKSQYSAYDVYSATAQGQQTLRGLASSSPPPLMLPVPASVREEDRKAREAKASPKPHPYPDPSLSSTPTQP